MKGIARVLSIIVCAAVLMGVGEARALGKIVPFLGHPEAPCAEALFAGKLESEKGRVAISEDVFIRDYANVKYCGVSRAYVFIVELREDKFRFLRDAIWAVLPNHLLRRVGEFHDRSFTTFVVKFVRQAPNKDIGPDRGILCRGLPFIYHAHRKSDLLAWLNNASALWVSGNIRAQLSFVPLEGIDGCTLCGNCGPKSGGVGVPVKFERVDQAARTDERKERLEICRYYLPFSGCSASISSVGGLYLGVQVIGIVLVGGLFAFAFVAGLVLRLDNLDPLRRRVGTLAMGVSFPAGLFFYCWAFSGHPWGVLHPFLG